MSTRCTLWSSDSENYSIYEETLENPIRKDGFRVFYPVHVEVSTPTMNIDIRLPDDLSIQLAEAKR